MLRNDHRSTKNFIHHNNEDVEAKIMRMQTEMTMQLKENIRLMHNSYQTRKKRKSEAFFWRN